MSENRFVVQRIVSGGQTGVDRAGLDVAIKLGIPHGGFCPKGRLAEDGKIPGFYELEETPEREYQVRTEKNVLHSDGTLLIYRGSLKGGTLLTRRLAVRHVKPSLRINLNKSSNKEEFVDWIACNKIATLNIAGPRLSSDAKIYNLACELLLEWLVADDC